jgi:DNA polymerase III epsilon subunit-like protein
MCKKILFNDCETGGTDPKKHALLQLSCIMEYNGKIQEVFNKFMRPMPGKIVDPESLKVTGFTMNDVNNFDDPYRVYNEFRLFCARHGKAKDKENRFIMAGYNNQFDCDFLAEWHLQCSGGTYAYWDYLQYAPVDPLPVLRAMRYAGILPINDTKLETVCDYFGITIKAHDAMSDVFATRELIHLLYGKIFSLWTGESRGLLPQENIQEMLVF